VIAAEDRLKAICATDRVNEPFMWSVAAWNETCDLWVGEGTPVRNLDDMKGINVHLLGYQDQTEAIPPVGATNEVCKVSGYDETRGFVAM